MPLPRAPKTLPYGFRDFRDPFVWAKRHHTGAWLSIRHFKPRGIKEEGDGYYTVEWSNRASTRTNIVETIGHYDTRPQADVAATLTWKNGPDIYVVPFKKSPRDNQKERVYAWENHAMKVSRWEIMSPEEVTKLVEKVFRENTVDGKTLKTPQVAFSLKNGAHATFLGRRLNFSRWGRRFPVVLHECAHSFMYARHGWSIKQSHGPEFVATFIQLAARYCNGFTEGYLRIEASRRKVKVAAEGVLDVLVSEKSYIAA